MKAEAAGAGIKSCCFLASSRLWMAFALLRQVTLYCPQITLQHPVRRIVTSAFFRCILQVQRPMNSSCPLVVQGCSCRVPLGREKMDEIQARAVFARSIAPRLTVQHRLRLGTHARSALAENVLTKPRHDGVFTRLMTPHIMQHWFGFEQLVLTKAKDAQSQDAIVRFGPMGAPCSPRGGQGGERACHTAPPSRCRSPAYCSRSCRRAPHHRTLPDRRRPHPSFSYLPIFLSTKEANP